MEKIHYHIHNLINIYVDPRVPKHVIESIDFQIGYFKNKKADTEAPYYIFIKPLAEFYPKCDLHTFHMVQGIPKKCFMKSGEFVFLKEDRGYTIYVKTSFFINIFIQFLLIKEGISLLHAAAVEDESGQVILLPGAGGVGKTAILGYMVKEHNYRLLGDDIVGLSEKGSCYSFPRSFVLKEYHESVYPEVFRKFETNSSPMLNSKTFDSMGPIVAKLLRFIWANAPFVGLTKSILRRLSLFDDKPMAPYVATLPVEDIFGSGVVSDLNTLKRIVFLERYSGPKFRIAELNEDSLTRRMFSIIHHEWVDSMREMFTLGAFEMEDISEYFARTTSIIKSGISGKRCDLLLIPDGATPRELEQYYFAHLI